MKKPIVIRGAAAKQLRNLEALRRRITSFAPLNAVEAETRNILLKLLDIERTQLRRQILSKLVTKLFTRRRA